VRFEAPVLIITPRWRRDGGVGTHVMASAAALAAQGVEVHVAASVVEDSEQPAGVELHHAPRLLDRGLAPEQRLAGAPAAARMVVHMHQFEDLDVARALAGRGAALALSVHGYSACTSGVHYFAPGQECPRAHGPLCAPNLLLRGCAHTRNPTWLPRAYAEATRAARLLAEVDLAITYSAVIDRHVAANGARERAILPLFPTLEASHASPAAARPRRVLYAGRVVGAKGLGVLLRAMRVLDAELIVCGDGHDVQRMRALARRLGISDRVAFRGWLAPSELARELAGAAVVAVPSLWPEPFGLVGLEAFGAATPVVASDTGGIREWLDDGVNGLAVAPGDEQALAAALRRLLDDAALRERLGAAGKRLVAERFTAERHVEAALAAYERALAIRQRSSAAAPPPVFS